MRQRATAVILKDKKLLLIRRIKPDADYYIFPGGGIEDHETIEQALIREVKEELSLNIKSYKLLFLLENISLPETVTIHKDDQTWYIFQITEYSGIPEIGGPEKERETTQNQYHIEWVELSKLQSMKHVYPEVLTKRLLEDFS